MTQPRPSSRYFTSPKMKFEAWKIWTWYPWMCSSFFTWYHGKSPSNPPSGRICFEFLPSIKQTNPRIMYVHTYLVPWNMSFQRKSVIFLLCKIRDWAMWPSPLETWGSHKSPWMEANQFFGLLSWYHFFHHWTNKIICNQLTSSPPLSVFKNDLSLLLRIL